MLSNSKLEQHLWVEEIRTTCYLINHSSSTVLDDGICEEVWMGKKVDYSHLFFFLWEAFMHIPKEHRRKSKKSKKCVFLGYVDGEFGYHLWDPVNHKIVRRSDVIFNEFEMHKRIAGET